MSPLVSFSEGAKLGIPINSVTVKSSAPLVVLAARINGSTDENTRAALAALASPARHGRRGSIAAGTIDGEELNAADFQIAPSIRLAMTMVDLRPRIESRPAGAHALRVVPKFAGEVPPILPAAWLAD